MAEPISLVASGFGLADVATRLIVYLKDVKAAAETVQDDIDSLISEIETLKTVHENVEQELKRHAPSGLTGQDKDSLWFHTGKTLKGGQILIEKLERCVKEIYGEDPKVSGKRDGLSKQHRKRTRHSRLADLRDQVNSYNSALGLWMSIISLCTAHGRHNDITALLNQLHAAVSDVNQRIDANETSSQLYDAEQESQRYQDFNKASVSALGRISTSINALEASLRRSNTNKHFDTPQVVDRFYTGREREAELLAQWLLQPSQAEVCGQKQRRFVVYGVGGSGKTQFCCKFADDNRERFWGVFWIDARNRQLLKQTLAQNVSRIAEVDANENAALHWLSNLEERWLLIIDNADDPEICLDDYLPKGNRGHVLITTRNPTNQSYGNVGPGLFEFHGLKDDEANSLLLKAAGQIQPWDSTLSRWATRISEALGYLALAIAVAGAAIREGFCQLHEYLDYHEQQRLQRPERRRAQSPTKRYGNLEDSRYGSVEATFDISFRAIANRGSEESRDALQLLKLFAFLHCENIRFEFLEKAVTNITLELKQQAQDKEREHELQTHNRNQTWSMWTSTKLFNLLTYFYRNRSLPVLPEVLRCGRKDGCFDRSRVRAAMRQLTQCSLVMHHNERDSYSMHPLVHKWARETPDMTIGEQGVWSEAAAVLLSCCILLPPLGTTTNDEEMRKDLLPHVDHVRDQQTSIERRIKERRMARMKPWPIFEGGFNSDRALMYAKFSIVYAQNGRWEDAKSLQLAVQAFAMKILGMQHPTTRRITLALATTYFQLGQSNEAAQLQEQVVDACCDFLGPDHHDTLVAKQSLGESRYLQGRFTDARKLQEEAVAGLKRRHGLHHEDTLNAIDCLGRTTVMFYKDEDIRLARELHQTAIDGMRSLHGAEHLRTLVACENLSSAAVLGGDRGQLVEAEGIMNRVLEVRKEKLGREHGYTLLAMVNLALVRKGLGKLGAAEELMLEGLPVAKRNLGEDHIAYLWGRYHLGSILVKQERWIEAETLLLDVTERQRNILQGRGRHHPDRIGGLVELATVYNALGKHDECDLVVDEALYTLGVISIEDHPVAQKLRADRESWVRNRSGA